MIQWHTHAGNITTNLKVKIYFTLPEFSMKKVVMWKCHVHDSAKGKYNMILGRDILTSLLVNNKNHDISLFKWPIKASKFTKNINGYYSNILHECMNTSRIKAEFKKLWIFLDSVCSFTIAMIRLLEKLKNKIFYVINGTHKRVILPLILRLNILYIAWV